MNGQSQIIDPRELASNMKDQAKAAGMPFVKSVVAGLLGALVGKGLGRPSLLAGLAVTYAGHMHGAKKAAQKEDGQIASDALYEGDSPIVAFGLGMIAGGAMSAEAIAASGSDNQTVSGQDYVDGVKERLQQFKDDLYNRLYFDKFVGSSSSDANNQKQDNTTSGIGEITLFQNGSLDDVKLDNSTLDKIERQLQQKAIAYDQGASSEQSKTVSGIDAEEDDAGYLFDSRHF